MREFITGSLRLDFMRRFSRDERGATAIEYALIAGSVCVAIVSAVTLLGTTIMTTFYNGLAKLF